MEEELSFKRFSDSKQEQIRQFVAYAQLMGLSGKDLVSIGGKLTRIDERNDRKHRLSVVKSYAIKPIGRDTTTELRFKIEVNNVWYHVVPEYYSCLVKNSKTGAIARFNLSHNDWGRTSWQSRYHYQFLWELHQGNFTLP